MKLNFKNKLRFVIGMLIGLYYAIYYCPRLTAQQSSQIQPSEYEIKAAFIYNFAKFVEWPSISRQASQDSMVIGILGQDPFGFVMEKVIGEKTVGGKILIIQRYRSLDQVRNCHVLFICDSERSRLDTILSYLSGRHILTVADFEDFAKHGGMIQLFMENKRIRFTINIDEINDANLKLSSKLLNLANVIKNNI